MRLEKPTVSIIILNYNGGQDVMECLESVSQIDYPGYEVILVDNASVDGSLSNIKDKFPQIKIIENHTNLGVPEGYNVGIRESKAPFVLLLNDDAIVGKSLLKDLVEAMQADQNTGIAGPQIMYHDKPDKIWCAGGKISPFGYASHLGKGKKVEACHASRPVDYICGCAMLIRREVVDKIGLLDPGYFAYFEDADYCYRARKAGFSCSYVASPTIWHKSGSEWITNPFQAYYYMRNAFVFAGKNLEGLKKSTFILSQVFFMFPYYSLKLIGRDKKSYSQLAKGVRDGLRFCFSSFR